MSADVDAVEGAMSGEFGLWMAGTICLGLVVGWLVHLFLKRAPTLPLKALPTLVTVVGGGAALAFVSKFVDDFPPVSVSGYFIGMLLAIVILRLVDEGNKILSEEDRKNTPD